MRNHAVLALGLGQVNQFIIAPRFMAKTGWRCAFIWNLLKRLDKNLEESTGVSTATSYTHASRFAGDVAVHVRSIIVLAHHSKI